MENGGGATKREFLRYGGTLLGGTGLTGCLGGGEAETEPDASDTDDGSDSDSSEGDTGTYSVKMEPVGEVEFDGVPERWIPYDGGYADMGVALGRGEDITGIGNGNDYYTYVYDELPGVDVSEQVEENPEVRTKEEFYELENDVHLYDPEMLIHWFDWSQDDVDEIHDRLAPLFGNLIFRRSDDWHEHRYYTLYEAFEKVAEVFQEQERYNAFKELHDDYISNIRSELPPEEDRPTVLLTFEGTEQPESFSPYRLDDKGTSKKQWNDLGVNDILSDTDIENLSTTNRGELDYENLLELDPEVLLVRGHERKSPSEFRETVLGYMQEHPVASDLTAVQNGRVYRGGYLHQGPIHNLFLTERAAQQLYPDVFGEVTGDRELFDRDRVAEIVEGDV